MGVIERLIEQAQQCPRSVVLPEGRDPRVLRAARTLKDERIADPIVLGKPEQIAAAAVLARVDLAGIVSIDPATSDRAETYARCYAEKRGLSLPIARRVVAKPTFFAGMMVALGDADTMVAGVATPTAIVIQAGALTVGFAPGMATPSSYFLMSLPEFRGETDESFLYADCAMNVDPTAAQLADIAIASEATAARLLEEEPRVALLSFSTFGSARHAHIDKVTEALKIIRQRVGRRKFDGEFQADAAIVPEVAARNVKNPSDVAGRANVLIFPDLNSANIAYKLTQYMAGARALGPLLQGFAKPISDLSRGAQADDIVATTAVCLAQTV